MPTIEIPWSRTDLIEAHKSGCPYCIKTRKQLEEERLLKLEGPRRLHYSLTLIAEGHDANDYYERLKTEIDERKAQGEEISYVELQKLKNAEYDAGSARKTIQREREEIRRLLNHETNETVKAGARKAYLRYVEKMKQLKNKKKE